MGVWVGGEWTNATLVCVCVCVQQPEQGSALPVQELEAGAEDTAIPLQVRIWSPVPQHLSLSFSPRAGTLA